MWKVYFWVYTILTIIGFGYYANFAPISFAEILGIIQSIILLVALYSYVFKKKMLDKKTWKVLFSFIFFFLIFDLIVVYFISIENLYEFIPFLKPKIEYSNVDVFLGWLISLPAVYAAYRLSKK